MGGWRRRDRGDDRRRQPRVPDGLPQGRRARSPRAAASRRHGRLAAARTAGSPLRPEGYDYVYEQLGPDVLLINGSGGTDVCSAIVSGCPMLPVYRGEIAGRCLGVDTAAFDLDGNEVVGELGELVIRQPMPSMPVQLLGRRGRLERYRAAYFDIYPGVWRQGDWVRFSEQGTCVITGRSDATLNRGGVRMGTSELYAVVEEFAEVEDSLIVHLEDDEGGRGRAGPVRRRRPRRRRCATGAAAQQSRAAPRHAPDAIAAVRCRDPAHAAPGQEAGERR